MKHLNTKIFSTHIMKEKKRLMEMLTSTTGMSVSMVVPAVLKHATRRRG
jgi:hypothetical protein